VVFVQEEFSLEDEQAFVSRDATTWKYIRRISTFEIRSKVTIKSTVETSKEKVRN
jgi:hypothetical protein